MRLDHTYHDFFFFPNKSVPTRGEGVADLVPLFLVPWWQSRINFWGTSKEHVIVVAPMVPESVTLLFLYFSVAFFSRAGNGGGVDAQMAMNRTCQPGCQVQKWYGEEKSYSQ
jgi:hypothetical protein